MLHNQYKRLEHGEELSKSATRFLSAVTTYINNCTNNFDRNSDFNIFPTLVTHVQNSDVQSTASSDHVETSGACATEQVKN
jgi:hypothetical protein